MLASVGAIHYGYPWREALKGFLGLFVASFNRTAFEDTLGLYQASIVWK